MAKNSKKPAPPKTMSIQEASDFWDEHSLLEFEGTEEVQVKFKLKKKQYIGIDRRIFKRLNAQARRHNVTPEALLESWITEKTR
jgi:hypothetical protein